ncbi:amino acid permease-domain-containing protein [Nemania sp. FL0916]|nr:amino acid permease-domain-containing protein [Nemania sp. FL0916]
MERAHNEHTRPNAPGNSLDARDNISNPEDVFPNSHAGSPIGAILVWLFAGLLVWTGASTIPQLGSSMPQNGGIQDYLRTCYGDFFGFLFVWIWVFMAKPCANAMASFIFAEHFCKLVWGIEDPKSGMNTVVALLSLALVTFINCRGAASGARVANEFLALKLFTVASIVLSGIFFISLAPLRFSHEAGRNTTFSSLFTADPARDKEPEQPGQPDRSPVDYVSAIFGALFAYGGWENIGFLAGELQQASKMLPRIVNTAMTVSISCFMSLNITLYAVLPIDVLKSTNKVAIVFGSKVFGKFSEDFYSILVSLSCLGSLNANTFAIGRLAYEAGRRAYFPTILGQSWEAKETGLLQGLLGSDSPTPDAINPVYGFSFSSALIISRPERGRPLNSCAISQHRIIH